MTFLLALISNREMTDVLSMWKAHFSSVKMRSLPVKVKHSFPLSSSSIMTSIFPIESYLKDLNNGHLGQMLSNSSISHKDSSRTFKFLDSDKKEEESSTTLEPASSKIASHLEPIPYSFLLINSLEEEQEDNLWNNRFKKKEPQLNHHKSLASKKLLKIAAPCLKAQFRNISRNQHKIRKIRKPRTKVNQHTCLQLL